jgi:hypothetical protein
MGEYTYDINKYRAGSYEFTGDLIGGKIGEKEMANYITTKGYKFIHMTQGNDNRYDIMMEYAGKQYTYEIKTDTYAETKPITGNIAIEFECRGKPSGIAVTEADYFTTFFPFEGGEIWNIRTELLRWIIANHNLYIATEAGDKGSNTKLYLISKKKFRQYFRVHKITPRK